MKWNAYAGNNAGVYFWRTHQQQEIDYVEDENGVLHGFEFKWKTAKRRPPQLFLDTYPGSQVEFIDRQNYQHFAGSRSLEP